MNNTINESLLTKNFFRQYLLGESVKNILIRLTVILSSILLVWCGIMFALIIHTKCQRTKQILKTSSTHHHLYDSSSSLNRKRPSRSRRNRRFNSLSSARCYSIRRLLSQLKQHCSFWPSSSASETSMHRSSSILNERKQPFERFSKNIHSPSDKIQSMSKRSIISNHHTVNNIGKKISLYRDIENISGDELKSLNSHENEANLQIEIDQNPSNTTQLTEPKSYVHYPSISLPINEGKDDHSATKHLQKLHQFNTKATLFFHPISRRFSNLTTNTSFPPTNAIQKQHKSKALLMVSSARELTTNDEWKWQHSIIDDLVVTDGSRTSSSRHIPLVMITDTSSSNTNIVELETFEDKQRLVGDVERRLSKELRASYGPRHST